jgi:signal transduction histidine kinase
VAVLAIAGGVQAGAATGWNPGAIAMQAAVAIPLLWRGRYPLAVFAAVVAASLLGPRLAPDSGLTYAVFAAVLLAAYTLGARERHWPAALAVLAAASVTIAMLTAGQPPALPGGMLPGVLLAVTWLAGFNVRRPERRADELALRHQETAQAVAAERAAIARELHDVVAHSVSVMLIQAGAARHKLPTAPDKTATALLAVESAGRDALAELRHLLGLLDPGPPTGALHPQPGLDQLDTLLPRIRDAGVSTGLTTRGKPRPLPPGISLAAYRIIQEALTNVLKHAQHPVAHVTVDYGNHELAVQIHNTCETDQATSPGPNPTHRNLTGGRGLIGMRERVGLYGGTLSTGSHPDGGYTVEARFPLPPPDPVP